MRDAGLPFLALQEIIHIQKFFLIHVLNVSGSHSFWWVIYVFFV